MWSCELTGTKAGNYRLLESVLIGHAVRMRSRLCTALSPMQRGFLSRLISRAVRGAHIPANERLSVVLTHLRHSNNLLHTMSYSIIERGQPNTLEYRIFYSKFLRNFWLEMMRDLQ